MLRCREFADEVATRFGLPLEIDFNLREVGFGSWEGRTPDEIRRDNPEEYNAFFLDPVNNRPAGAEPLQDFYNRSVESIRDLAQKFAGEQLLVVTHAGVMRAIAAWLMEAPLASMYRLRVNYATLYRVQVEDDRLRLEI